MRRSYAFLEHTQQTLAGNDPDAAFAGSELDRIPSFTAVRSRTRAAGAGSTSTRGRRRTSWGYEFYTYRRHAFEKTQHYIASPSDATRSRC